MRTTKTTIGLTDEEKERIQKCLDEIPDEITLRSNAIKPLREMLVSMKIAHNGKTKCYICGKTAKSATGVCGDCLKQFIAEHNAKILANKGYNSLEYANWAFVDDDAFKQEILSLCTPGTKMSAEQLSIIFGKFAEYQSNFKKNQKRRTWNFCFVCGGLQYSAFGLCPKCRQHLRTHGCLPPIKDCHPLISGKTIKLRMPPKNTVLEGMTQRWPLKKV